MIKKLKRKFILIFMSIVMVTLVIVFLVAGISSANKMKENCKNLLSSHLSDNKPRHGGRGEVSLNDNVLTFHYAQSGRQIDSSGNQDNYSLTEEEMNTIKQYIRNAQEDFGTVPNYSIAYMRQDRGGEMYIAICDVSSEWQTLRYLILSFLAASVIALVLFYFISLVLSHWCIKPIEDTWNRHHNFIADASHELKTPLTVILANTAILKEHKSASIQSKEKCIYYIEDEAKHMSHLVNDLLFLARVDAVGETIKKEKVDFSKLCVCGYLPFEALAFEKSIGLTADIEEGLFVEGDSVKLNQLFGILLDNACKYTAADGTIHISLQKKGNGVLLQVNNSGAPIPKEQISHLFDRFYRVDEARTRTNAGYGLGLSIAYSIVQMHHGRIRITSTVEKGTTVLVELPLSM